MNRVLIILLAIAGIIIFALSISNKAKDTQLDDYLIETGTLPESVQAAVKIEGTKLIVQNKVTVSGPATTAREPAKVKTEIKYIPPEGKATVEIDNAGKATVKAQTKGFCCNLAISATIGQEGFKFGIQSRLFYINRYGLGCGFNSKIRPYAFIDRRVDDFVPFVKDTTIGINYDGSVGISLSIFF